MSRTTASTSIQDIADSLASLLGSTLDTGLDLIQSVGKAGSELTQRIAPQVKLPKMPKLGGCCEIPPPCWMPKELGPVSSHVCPGGAATLHLRITNGGMTARTIRVQADQGATVAPSQLELAPFQRGWVTVSYTVPTGSSDSECQEILVSVQGCNSFYLRWSVRSSKRGCACCHELDVEDCPDLVHHWYDHFYCPRPCPTQHQMPGQ